MQMPFRSPRFQIFGILLLIGLNYESSRAQTFSATSELPLPLVCQTSTPLQDGTVLLAGGANNNSPYSTTDAFIYNPNAAAGTFAPTLGFMHVARACGIVATLLNDGTVLIFGGAGGDTSAELYFPSGGNFSLNTPPTSANPSGLPIQAMKVAQGWGATATLLQDGTVLIAGGDNDSNAGSTAAEIYNPAKGTFTLLTATLHTKRTHHTATLLRDGTVLIAAGEGNYSGQTAWNSAEIYNPSNQTFTTVGNLITARSQHTATMLTDGTVLLAGGNNNSGPLSSAEIYTPSSSSFNTTGSMNSTRYSHTATSLADGTVLIAGGFESPYSNLSLNTAEIYTPSQSSFRLTGTMTTPRALHSAVMLFNGDILLVGGDDTGFVPIQSAELFVYPVTMATMNPAYRVTSIIYAPPGNKSQDGFTNTTTNSTTTTIGSSFTQGSSITTTFGFSYPGVGGVSAQQSFGTSSTSSSSSAFQETFTNATGVANQSNSNAVDAINHNNDLFLIWLNPQITAFGNNTALGPVGYTVGIQPTADGNRPLPDILEVYASAMEPNSAGMTTVPAALLNQQVTTSGQYVPGMASFCKNVIKAEYAPPAGPPSTCTLADQCGCTPADFLPILKSDPLLFLNGITNPVSPYPGTTSPLVANTSNESTCGTLPVTAGSNCRYVPVPVTYGSTEQEGVTLEGPNGSGGNNPTNTFQQGENTQTTNTLGGQTSTTVSDQFQVNLGVSTGCISGLGLGSCSSGKGGTGNGSSNWGLSNTMTWTDSQSVGTASGSGVSLSVTLSSSTVGCAESNNISVFEDTVYHTFVFQQPPGNVSCSTFTSSSSTPENFSIAVINPSQNTPLSLGHSMTYTVDVSAWYGFSGTVALSVSGLPAGVMASFSPASVSTSGLETSTLTLTATYGTSTHVGNFNFNVTGTSGILVNSAIVNLTTQPMQYKGLCGVQ